MDNSVTSDMIRRFLNRQSDEAEAGLVSEYLKNNPHILEQYSNDAGVWQRAGDQHLSDDLRTAIWEGVEKEINVGKRLRFRFLAAAGIIGMLIGSYFFFIQNKKAIGKINGKNTAAIRYKKVIENNTLIEKEITLPDGTNVILEPNSVVYYYSVFKNNRNIYLSGDAYFKVAHDKVHPFTVYADSIGTTALGTHFWVKSSNRESLTVKLLEGKVVVRAFGKRIVMKDVFLTPGEKVVINKRTGIAMLSRFKRHEIKKNVKKAIAIGDKIKGKTVWTNAAYTFSKASLVTVFNKIELQYHVRINVNGNDISGFHFTGKIMYDDSLNTIMTAICNVNGLIYSRSGNIITIGKK